TTTENAEQGWLDSNLARIGGLLQGQRDLTEVCNMIMTEVAPLVNAQVGAFFLRPVIDGSGPAEWRLAGSYGLVGGPQVTFQPGEGLVGQAGADKQVILLTSVPAGYLPI
ncbi:MAG: hybrid sensor histidine kinase/response regulator, partial [Pyrinomonadaceae bacterium]